MSLQLATVNYHCGHSLDSPSAATRDNVEKGETTVMGFSLVFIPEAAGY